MTQRLTGLIAATHTPMTTAGKLWIDPIDAIAAHLSANSITGVFVGGTTGESLSLSLAERLELSAAWAEAGRKHNLKVVVHAGCNSLPESQKLAAQAGELEVAGVSVMAPSFFKPSRVAELAEYCASIAGEAPDTPFYYYHIPPMTGVDLSMVEFLEQGKTWIPTLAGLKYSSLDMVQLQEVLTYDDGAYDVLFGCDEALMAGMALGVQGAVGSTYNFAAPLYHQLIAHYNNGEMESARKLQRQSVAIVRICQQYGFLGAAKVVMKLIGIDCGPVRSPLAPLTNEQIATLERELEAVGLFEWTPKPAITAS